MANVTNLHTSINTISSRVTAASDTATQAYNTAIAAGDQATSTARKFDREVLPRVERVEKEVSDLETRVNDLDATVVDLPDPNDGGIDGRALVSKNGKWELSDSPPATAGELGTVSGMAGAAHDRIDVLETDVAQTATHADYAYNAVISLGPQLANLEIQVGKIDTALDEIIAIQQSLIDSALPQAEGVEF